MPARGERISGLGGEFGRTSLRFDIQLDAPPAPLLALEGREAPPADARADAADEEAAAAARRAAASSYSRSTGYNSSVTYHYYGDNNDSKYDTPDFD